MDKDQAERLKMHSCYVLEVLEQRIIDTSKGILPKEIIKDLNKVANKIYKYNQKMVKLSK